MKDPVLISCIVPVYNGERYLSEALDSIIAQTYRPLEIIVVDDGSTDETPHIVARYGQQISYLRQSNQGPAAARNRGVDSAHGEFIAFLDADDLWHKEKLARQMACFKVRPELELCITHIKNFWVPELKHEQEQLKNSPLAQEQPGPSQTILARHTLFNRVGKFDETILHRDTMEWILRSQDLGATCEILSKALVYRRIHDNNLSRRRSTIDRRDLLDIVKSVLIRRRETVDHEPMTSAIKNDLTVKPPHNTKDIRDDFRKC